MTVQTDKVATDIQFYYKVLSQVLLRRMLRTLDQHQPREQAGFRSGLPTIDHIQVISQLREKADKIPLCSTFVVYGRAFDCIEFNILFEARTREPESRSSLHNPITRSL